jgi:hypothetical protein
MLDRSVWSVFVFSWKTHEKYWIEVCDLTWSLAGTHFINIGEKCVVSNIKMNPYDQ